MSDEVLSQAEIEALMNGGGAAASDTPAAPEPSAPAQEMAASPEVMDIPDVPIPQPAPTPAPEIRMSTAPEPTVRSAQFAPLSHSADTGMRNGVDLLLDVQLNVAVELGRANMHVREILGLGPGAVVELDKHSGEPVEVVVNGKLLARGEVVLIDENFGVRITEIVSKPERDAHAKAA